MHKPCQLILLMVAGAILGVLFLLLALCGRPSDSGPIVIVPVPVPTAPPVVVVPPVVPEPPVEPVVKTYTVVKGDTLWSIAEKQLGNPLLWPSIYKLNTDVVECPHWIYPGEVLVLPN